MRKNVDDGRPIFEQVADSLEAQILDGSLAEESQIPSINELAQFHRINPATALRGVNLLVDTQTLYKRRGIGMFVADGARQRLLEARRAEFAAVHLRPIAERAQWLGLTTKDVQNMIEKEMNR